SIFQSMQDDPNKFADLQRAKYIMGLGEPILGSVSPEQTDRVLKALEALPRGADRQRLAMSLNVMLDGPFAAQLSNWSKGDTATAISELRNIVAQFVQARNWGRFHAP